VVVDDHHVGFGGALAHAGDEALAELGTFAAKAGVGGGGDLVPERQVLGQVAELGAVAGLGPCLPLFDHRQQERIGGGAGAVLVEPVQAQVIRPALHQRRSELHAERVLQRRQVLEEDLLLQVLGAGGDEQTPAAKNGGNQVSERFAGAGTGFHEQRAAVVDGRGNGLCHRPLSLARLVAVHRARQHAVRRERAGDEVAQRGRGRRRPAYCLSG
jgi:hypothetical protein